MYRIEINIYKKEFFVKLVIKKKQTEMHGQQNIKFNGLHLVKTQYNYSKFCS